MIGHKTTKRAAALFALLALCCALLTACTGAPAEETAQSAALADGTYLASFDTDSTMFGLNETKDGKGVLTVADGQMVIHITLKSKNFLNLFPGSAEDAAKDGAALLQPTVDAVTYPDGITEEVYGFDVPVPYLDETFACAAIGKKGVWYDHQVSVSDPQPMTADGAYTMEVTMTGGTGKASVASPAKVTVKDGAYTAELVWSSPNYDYMIVDDVRYEPVTTDPTSVFEIPIVPDTEMTVSADTVAMSQPHLIEYTLCFDGSTLQ